MLHGKSVLLLKKHKNTIFSGVNIISLNFFRPIYEHIIQKESIRGKIIFGRKI